MAACGANHHRDYHRAFSDQLGGMNMTLSAKQLNALLSAAWARNEKKLAIMLLALGMKR